MIAGQFMKLFASLGAADDQVLYAKRGEVLAPRTEVQEPDTCGVP